MKTDTTPAPPRGLERALATLLHYGTAVACATIGLGLVISWWGVSGRGVINAGIAAFILLPVLRLVCMLISFAQARDRRFVIITALVLAIMAVAFALGMLLAPHAH